MDYDIIIVDLSVGLMFMLEMSYVVLIKEINFDEYIIIFLFKEEFLVGGLV